MLAQGYPRRVPPSGRARPFPCTFVRAYTPLMGRTASVDVLLSSMELQLLTEAAKRSRVSLPVYLRTAALQAARTTVNDLRPTYTREQLMSIHRKARNKGHVWTEEELREQGLPLFWNEDWVRRRLSEGATRAELAVESGFQERTVTSYLQKVWGIRTRQIVTRPVKEHVRELVEAGMPRKVVARELGLSEHTVGTYARSVPGAEERKFQRTVALIPAWPATRTEIAHAAFSGDGPAASAWLRSKVRRGWLARVGRGVYDLTRTAPSGGGASASA